MTTKRRHLTAIGPIPGDPPERDDGRCARPGCAKPIPPVGRRNFDPFCSTDCARWWWEPHRVACRGWALAHAARLAGSPTGRRRT